MKTPIDMVSGSVHLTNNFGRLQILQYTSRDIVFVKFIDTGFKTLTTSVLIRSGRVRDKLLPVVFGVGFIGDGKYASSIKGSDTKPYVIWHSMLQRCYSYSHQEKNTAYSGVTVCNDWLNFQNFAEWFCGKYINGYEIDKDIKQRGIKRKIYSPETCLFVSKQENNAEAHAKTYTLKSPDGEIVTIHNLTKFCRDNGLTRANMLQVFTLKRRSCSGWTKA